jgi:hypothetical protein
VTILQKEEGGFAKDSLPRSQQRAREMVCVPERERSSGPAQRPITTAGDHGEPPPWQPDLKAGCWAGVYCRRGVGNSPLEQIL